MDSFINRKLVVAFNGEFKRQTAFGTPMPSNIIDTRHPQTEPTYPGRIITREEVRDCNGEYIIREEITSRLARLRFAFDADPYLLAGWLAMAQSAVSAPSGTRVNEVQTITPSGTISGGTWRIGLPFEGLTDYVDIPWNASAADIKKAIESLRHVRKNAITVTGTLATTVVITASGRFAGFNLPLFTVDASNLTGSTPGLGIVQTTAGQSKIHNIARTTLGQNMVTSIMVGFEDDTTPPDRYKDVVVNEITVRGEIRGKVTVELEVYASLDTDPIVGYVMPECVDSDPVYTKDCRLFVDDEYIVEELREFTYTYRNNIYTGDDSFPFDGIDVYRLNHGDRESRFDWTQYGSKGDTQYDLANDEEIVPVQLIIGSPANRVVIDAPAVQLQLSDDPITFAGEANRSAYAVGGPVRINKSLAGSPDRVFYYGPESTTFLTAA